MKDDDYKEEEERIKNDTEYNKNSWRESRRNVYRDGEKRNHVKHGERERKTKSCPGVRRKKK